MDLLAQHEAFLRAIFDAPDDDTPRLVYADFLQEHGEEDRAELIRVQCELVAEPWSVSDSRRDELSKAEARLVRKLPPDRAPESPFGPRSFVRGFLPPGQTFVITPTTLADGTAERWRVIRKEPESFGAQNLGVEPGLLLRPEHINLLLEFPVVQRIAEWFLNGATQEVEAEAENPGGFALIEMVQQPAVTTAGVEALANHKGVRRLSVLDLRNNGLDNDAARALVKSPYLDNLKRLQLLEGNRLRGKVWQQVIERFGENVVG